MSNIEKSMNENDLINEFDKEQLQEILEINIAAENYEGAAVIQSAIDQYDECGPFTNELVCEVDTEDEGFDFNLN